MLNTLTTPHEYPGKLFVVEGIDGSGKTTQLGLLANRYAYTAFARDATRGVDRQWVRELYSFAVKPDMALYFRVPIDVSVDRLLARRVKLKFYEAGMDMGWSSNPAESFRLFQGKGLDED